MKIIILFFFVFSTHAATLEEIKQLALERSTLLSANELEKRALSSEASVRGAWQNPQIMGQFGGLKSSTESGATAEVSFTQPVPLSNKFSLRKEAANLAISQQEVRGAFYKNWVSHQAVLSAWQVKVKYAIYNQGKERTKRIALIKSYLETRPRVSIGQRVEHSLIASVLKHLEKELDQKDYELRLSQADLEFWTGKKFDPADLNLVIPPFQKLKRPLAGNFENNPELRQAEIETKISGLDQSMAQKERRPDLFLGAGYRVENLSPVNHFSYGIVGLNIPIWDTGKAQLEAANARHKKNEKMLIEARRQAELKMHKQLAEVIFSLQQVERFPIESVKASQQSLREAESGFKQGVLDINTFIQAEAQSSELIDQVWLSWMNYLESLSGLALSQGEAFQWEKM